MGTTGSLAGPGPLARTVEPELAAQMPTSTTVCMSAPAEGGTLNAPSAPNPAKKRLDTALAPSIHTAATPSTVRAASHPIPDEQIPGAASTAERRYVPSRRTKTRP